MQHAGSLVGEVQADGQLQAEDVGAGQAATAGWNKNGGHQSEEELGVLGTKAPWRECCELILLEIVSRGKYA